MTMTRAHALDAIALAKDMRQAGVRYDLGKVSRSVTDCTGMAAILYNTCNGKTGDDRFRWRFWTGSPVSVFDNLGFTRLLGPAGSFQIGYSNVDEMKKIIPKTTAGHCGATVMGVNIEMSAHYGLRVGGAARGADHPWFKHQRHIPIVGATVAPGPPKPPVIRYPGQPIKRGSPNAEAVKWVQGRLNWYGTHLTVNGNFEALLPHPGAWERLPACEADQGCAQPPWQSPHRQRRLRGEDRGSGPAVAAAPRADGDGEGRPAHLVVDARAGRPPHPRPGRLTRS